MRKGRKGGSEGEIYQSLGSKCQINIHIIDMLIHVCTGCDLHHRPLCIQTKISHLQDRKVSTHNILSTHGTNVDGKEFQWTSAC